MGAAAGADDAAGSGFVVTAAGTVLITVLVTAGCGGLAALLVPQPAARVAAASAMPAAGAFGADFLQRLKSAWAGTSDGALIMETLHSIPPDQLKTALVSATPEERSLLFSVIPGDQIKSIFGTFPVGVLAPPELPPPVPAPVGGPPATILQTTYQNVPYAPADAGLEELWLWEDCFWNGGIASVAAALAWTGRLRVGIGVLPVPLRNVALAAMEIATLDREYLTALRALLRGEKLTVDGRYIRLTGVGSTGRRPHRPRCSRRLPGPARSG